MYSMLNSNFLNDGTLSKPFYNKAEASPCDPACRIDPRPAET
jgi:hypothetical protein